jgi:microcystin-dependent protein
VLPISGNEPLFSLLGTTYGGDGQTTFALPNLQGRLPIHAGQGAGLSNYIQGQSGGVESDALTAAAMPSHTHLAQCFDGAGNNSAPTGAVWANAGTDTPYKAGSVTATTMSAAALQNAGSSLPHENRQPLLALNYIIALRAPFPSRS